LWPTLRTLAARRSIQLAAFHESQVAYHQRMAREHGRRGHDGAELQHRQAAEAHEAHEAPPEDPRWKDAMWEGWADRVVGAPGSG
jgi:hypothetical protein